MYDNTIECEKLGDFNEVIEWYKRHLSIVKGMRPKTILMSIMARQFQVLEQGLII